MCCHSKLNNVIANKANQLPHVIYPQEMPLTSCNLTFLKRAALCRWWSRPTCGCFLKLPRAAEGRGRCLCSSCSMVKLIQALRTDPKKRWYPRGPWTRGVAAGTRYRCLARCRLCWTGTAACSVSVSPVPCVPKPAPCPSWCLQTATRVKRENNLTDPSSWLCSSQPRSTSTSAEGAAWSATAKSASAVKGSSTSTLRTLGGATGSSLRLGITLTTARATAPAMWQASWALPSPFIPPSSITIGCAGTAPLTTSSHAAYPRAFGPCPCSTTARSRRSLRKTSRTW